MMLVVVLDGDVHGYPAGSVSSQSGGGSPPPTMSVIRAGLVLACWNLTPTGRRSGHSVIVSVQRQMVCERPMGRWTTAVTVAGSVDVA
jgi:hypothetical protein